MHDLDVQIRAYLDVTSEPLTVDDILFVPVGDTPVRPITPRPTDRSSWRGWLIAGAAVAVVLVVLGLLSFLLRGGSIEPAATTIPVPTSVPTLTSVHPLETVEESAPTSVAPAVLDGSVDRSGPPFRDADLGAVEWVQIELDPFVAGVAGGIPVVLRDIDGYVISDNGVLTYSSDGRAWTTNPLSPELADYTAFRSQGEWAVAGTGVWRRNPSDSHVLLRSDGSQWNTVVLPDSDPAWPDLPIVSGSSILVPDDGGDLRYWVSTDGAPFVSYNAP